MSQIRSTGAKQITRLFISTNIINAKTLLKMVTSVSNTRYVLITPARNEEHFIEATICSVISQTILPKRWIIVSDASTDCTDSIVKKYADQLPFITLIRLESDSNRDFASKVFAIRAGELHLKDVEYDFIGNLDADITFDTNYYEIIMDRCIKNPKLGVVGGVLVDVCGDKLLYRFPRPWSVSGGIQFFRRQCYDDIGGYLPLPRGGVDTVAEVMARMHGWEVLSFPEIRVYHHRLTGTAENNILMTQFYNGIRGFSIGSHPLYEFLKCVRRIKARPFAVGAMMHMIGYIWACLAGEQRKVPDSFIKYYRNEQMKKIYSLSGEK